MANNKKDTDVRYIIELLRNRERDNKTSRDEEQTRYQWLESKGIDKDSAADVFSEMIAENVDVMMGRLVRTQSPEAIVGIVGELMGKALEIGYTISEIQLEETFLGGDDAKDN